MLTARDEMIAEDVIRLGALTTGMVARAYWPHMRSGHQMAQRRLLALYRARRLDRRAQVRADYVWVPPRSHRGDLEHALVVAQAWVELGCPKEFWTEHALGSFRADALFRMGATPYFLEVERSHNDLRTKMAKYMDTWRDRSVWSEQFALFPGLLLVVPSPAHVERAQALKGPPKHVCTLGGIPKALAALSVAAGSS